jgi:hypothetical protein
MKTRCLCAVIAVVLAAYLPVAAAEDTFQIEAIPLPGVTAADTSLPPVQMVSVTVAAASSVTVNPCIGGTRVCPDPTFGYASIPFPSAVLPAGGDVVVTWMFQDLSYSGPVQMTVAFLQNGVVVGQPSHSHSNPSVVAGDAYLVHSATVVPAQATAGPAMLVVNLDYGGTVTRASQQFTVAATPTFGVASPEASAPAIQMVSVTVAELGSVTVTPCVSGELGCPDPTQGYASIPFPMAVLALNSNACVTWMFQDVSYIGPIDITVAFVQGGAVVGQPSHFTGISVNGAGTYLLDDGPEIPLQATPGPAMVVVSLIYGGKVTQASQTFTLQ